MIESNPHNWETATKVTCKEDSEKQTINSVNLQIIPKMHMKFKNKVSFVLAYQDTITIKKRLSKLSQSCVWS